MDDFQTLGGRWVKTDTFYICVTIYSIKSRALFNSEMLIFNRFFIPSQITFQTISSKVSFKIYSLSHSIFSRGKEIIRVRLEIEKYVNKGSLEFSVGLLTPQWGQQYRPGFLSTMISWEQCFPRTVGNNAKQPLWPPASPFLDWFIEYCKENWQVWFFIHT